MDRWSGAAAGERHAGQCPSKQFTLTFKAVGAKQIPEAFEGGLRDTLTTAVTLGSENQPRKLG